MSAEESVGFLRDERRMNVAITRAQHALFIVGHANVMQQDYRWAQLISHAHAISRSKPGSCNRGCLTRVVLTIPHCLC